MTNRTTQSVITVLMIAAIALAGCANPPKKLAGPPIETPQQPLEYVAIGASESLGVGATAPLHDAWTKVLWTTAMPRQTGFTNLAVAGSTAADAVTQQLPMALSLHPDYVTIWLDVNDIIAGVTPADLERSLGQIVSSLHTQTKARILIANTPPLDEMPAYLRARSGDFSNRSPFAHRTVPTPQQLDTTVDAYNAAIAHLAGTNGATLVDLHAVGMAARQNGTEAALYGSDGFHPSTQGHAAVAQAFASALKVP